MLKNYVTIALRNFLRHKTYGLINSSGLSCVVKRSSGQS